MDAPPTASPAAPPVVAVMVTYDPGPWLEEALGCLRSQDYPDLSVLVIDAASPADPTARVAAVLPGAFVRRLDENPGFGAAANHALAMVEGAAYFLLCHDDVAPEPDTVRLLVEEALRSNAGIVGPKLVAWDDPLQLLQVGMAVDKTGAPSPLVERGELDQEQHDAVRDVFAVPGGLTLIRSDLLAALGGFDPAMTLHGEDIDLCWRAQVAGARVLVAPAARVRHLEALPRRHDDRDRRLLQTRHRLRTLLKAYGPFHLARVLPQALAAGAVETVYALVAARRGQARDVVSAWSWNVRVLGDTRRARKAVQRSRRLPDGEVRRLQVHGSARLNAYLRGQLAGGDDRAQSLAAAGRGFAGSLRRGPLRAPLVVWSAMALVLLVGTRGLIRGGLPEVGQLARFPGHATTFLGHFTAGWRDSGLGSDAPAPAAFGLLGVAGLALFGSTALLQKVLVLGALPAGVLGTWRLSRPLESRAGRLVAAAVYVAVPLPYDALSRGRWDTLVAYAALPWIVTRLLASSGLEPFGAEDRPFWRRCLSLGVLLALAAALVPALVLVVAIVAVGLAAGSLVAGWSRTALRPLAVAIGGVAVAAVLLFPWTLEFVLPGGDWASFAGVRPPAATAPGLGALLRFQVGPIGAAPLGWAFLLAAVLPLLIGRSWRLAWAARAWILAIVCWGLVWAGGRGWLPRALPTGVLLAPAALAVALAAALGLVAFDTDLRGYRFGWRQLCSVVAAGALAAGALPVLGAAAGGRWHMPRRDYARTLAWMRDDRSAGSFRVLWMGDPEALPVEGWRLDEGLAYALSRDGPGSALERWPEAADGPTRLVADAVVVARGGGTTRLGHLLAPMAIRYVIVPDRPAPGGRGRLLRPPETLRLALGAQIDLRRVESDPDLTLYENTAWTPRRAQVPPSSVPDVRRAGPDAALSAELAGLRPAVDRDHGAFESRGPVARGALLFGEAASPDWRLRVDGRTAERVRAFGWANAFLVPSGGQAVLRYRSTAYRLVLVAVEAALWVAALRALARRRRRKR